MNVGEALDDAVRTLEAAGVESPTANAEWLMVHLLNCSRPELALRAEEPLTDPLRARWEQLLTQRAQRIPLQHLVGTVDFCGLELAVNRQVLVPRPETELLAEAAWSVAAAMEAPAVLDLGTGSGCLAIAVAVHAPDSAVHAVDISPQALQVARANAERHGLGARVQFYEAELQHAPPLPGLMDVIVSNPPYIPSAEIATLAVEVRDHDPHVALDGGEDGLVCYRHIAEEYLSRLQPHGRMLLEVGDGQAPEVSEILEQRGGRVLEVVPDLNNIERIVVASPAIP